MTFILNLTQHPATKEQKTYGVKDIEGELLDTLKRLLTFEELPSRNEITQRALQIAALATTETTGQLGKVAMIGGAGYLLPELTMMLKAAGFTVLQSFTKREVVESTSPTGEVVKTAVFRHIGFVEC